MLSFLLLLPNFDFELNSCHLFLPASSSFLALIFLAFGGLAAALSDSASFFASGYTVAPAEETTPGAGADGIGAVGGGGGASAFLLLEIGRISLALRVSVLS